MTISTLSSQATYLGNNSLNVFNFSFIANSAAFIEVVYTDANGVPVVLPSSVYTLFINAPAPGQIWGIGGTVTYPIVGSPIAFGTSLTVRRVVPFTQVDTISNQGNYAPQVTEEALDTLCMEIQQAAARGGLYRGVWSTGILYNIGDMVVDGVNGTNTGNYYNAILAGTSTTWAADLAAGNWNLQIDIQGIEADTAAAAASAAAALASQIAAASSASAANTSANNAATSATTATTQATNASNSATSASTSAGTATTQAGIATAQAVIATTQAGIATTQAGNASTSATNAGNSATAAGTSATNANNSAIAAAASAVLAASTFIGTSTTSNTISVASGKSFTTQTNKNFQANQYMLISDSGNSSNWMFGQVTSYNNGTGALVFDSQVISGAGTLTSWNISISGIRGAAGSGNVSSVSVVTANGFAGSVATPTTTPAITVSTNVTGIIKGNGTAISAATSGTDYSAGTSALATGIVKTTTTTGALSVAVAGDFPTLNQSTTGSAATLTTGRTIAITGDLAYTSGSFNGSANVTGAGTLATVNSNVGSFTTASITVNAKGLVTAAANGPTIPTNIWLSDNYNYNYYYDDFVGKTVGSYVTSVTGTGATTTLPTGGGAQVNTGTTATGSAVIGALNPAVGVGTRFDRYNNSVFNTQISIGTISDATNRFYTRCGVGETVAVEPTNGIYFRQKDDVNSAGWQGVCRAGGVESVVNSAVIPVGNVIVTLSYVVNNAASSVEFFINGSTIGSVSSNIPLLTAGAVTAQNVMVQTQKTVGTTVRTANAINWTFTRSRI